MDLFFIVKPFKKFFIACLLMNMTQEYNNTTAFQSTPCPQKLKYIES